MLETALFYLISALAILSAIGVITAKSPVHGVLWLVASMAMLAGLFVLLKAFLVAIILILVYAGAILVLFLFVVMLIDIRNTYKDWQTSRLASFSAIALACLLLAVTLYVIRTIPTGPTVKVHGTIQNIGVELFRSYVLPFELTAFLVLSAVVSVVVLAKKDAE